MFLFLASKVIAILEPFLKVIDLPLSSLNISFLTFFVRLVRLSLHVLSTNFIRPDSIRNFSDSVLKFIALFVPSSILLYNTCIITPSSLPSKISAINSVFHAAAPTKSFTTPIPLKISRSASNCISSRLFMLLIVLSNLSPMFLTASLSCDSCRSVLFCSFNFCFSLLR